MDKELRDSLILFVKKLAAGQHLFVTYLAQDLQRPDNERQLSIKTITDIIIESEAAAVRTMSAMEAIRQATNGKIQAEEDTDIQPEISEDARKEIAELERLMNL